MSFQQPGKEGITMLSQDKQGLSNSDEMRKSSSTVNAAAATPITRHEMNSPTTKVDNVTASLPPQPQNQALRESTSQSDNIRRAASAASDKNSEIEVRSEWFEDSPPFMTLDAAADALAAASTTAAVASTAATALDSEDEFQPRLKRKFRRRLSNSSAEETTRLSTNKTAKHAMDKSTWNVSRPGGESQYRSWQQRENDSRSNYNKDEPALLSYSADVAKQPSWTLQRILAEMRKSANFAMYDEAQKYSVISENFGDFAIIVNDRRYKKYWRDGGESNEDNYRDSDEEGSQFVEDEDTDNETNYSELAEDETATDQSEDYLDNKAQEVKGGEEKVGAAEEESAKTRFDTAYSASEDDAADGSSEINVIPEFPKKEPDVIDALYYRLASRGLKVTPCYVDQLYLNRRMKDFS